MPQTPQTPNAQTPINHLAHRLRKLFARGQNLLAKDIWELQYLGAKTLQARIYLVLRVLTLTTQGLRRNRIPSQAAALTFYSLIGIGPLIALGIMISSFVMEPPPANLVEGEPIPPNIVVEAITKAIVYAAPQIAVDLDLDDDVPAELAPEISEMINNFIDSAQSGTVGIIGSLMLFVIALQVLSSIESSFNTLWGVEHGRKLGERIVTYWTFISLGAVLGAASLTLRIIPKISQVMEKVPHGSEFLELVLFFSPILAFVLIVILLTAFFRFIPNTKVHWKAALTGATLIVTLLHLYNKFSFLYVQRVVDTRSLYGSVGIIVVLMLGFYVFWLLILLGGQVTYAVQNADYLTNENAWQRTSHRTRELVSLAALFLVAERFKSGNTPMRGSELHQKLRVPSHIMNACTHRLCELGYLYTIEPKTIDDERDHSYQPGHPLESITLGSFKQSFEAAGNNTGAEIVAKIIPGVQTYLDEVVSLKGCTQAELTINELLREHSDQA